MSPPKTRPEEGWRCAGLGDPHGQGVQPSQDLAPEIFPIFLLCNPRKPHFVCLPTLWLWCNSQRSSNISAHLGICLISHRFFPLNTHKALEMRYTKFLCLFFLGALLWKPNVFTPLVLLGWSSRSRNPGIIYVLQIFWMDGAFHLPAFKTNSPKPLQPQKFPQFLGRVSQLESPSIYLVYLHGK